MFADEMIVCSEYLKAKGESHYRKTGYNVSNNLNTAFIHKTKKQLREHVEEKSTSSIA